MRILLLILFTSHLSMARLPFGFMVPIPASSSDPCDGVALGAACTGGGRYAGVFDGAKYMVTPGNCTNSSTPTCDGTRDTLTKYWRGSSGSYGDIAGMGNTSSGAELSSASYRGDVNTAAGVASGLLSADSALHFCDDMNYGGFTDWYLPSKTELIYIYCKSDGTHTSPHPAADPDCLQIAGGKTSSVGGFDRWSTYFTSTERDSNVVEVVDFQYGTNSTTSKTSNRRIRCIRRYGESLVDGEPNAIAWADFSGASSSQAISGFDETILLELSAVNVIGSPTLEYRVNAGSWVAFTTASPAIILVRSGNTIEFQVSGTSADSATITVKNDTKGGTVLDTVTGTVP